MFLSTNSFHLCSHNYPARSKFPNTLYYTKIDQHFNQRKLGWGFNDKNYYIFENPLITAYDYKKDQVNIWHLKGKYGDLKNNEIAFVKDDVLIYPGFTGSQLKKAVADYLYYDINKNLVTSKSTVTIYGQGIKTTGTDFSLDLNKNVMSYKGQPNATYYPNSK